MLVRALNLLHKIRSSLWFVPTLMSIATFLLAILSQAFDRKISAGELENLQPFLYSGDLDGARVILSTVAGSMMTVAGVTFSVTMVALSMASAQFGPRLLQNFMQDRGNQMVLGTFISTFLFCIIALSSGEIDKSQVVPTVSVSICLLLSMVSLSVLIFFIHHVASSIRADHVIDVVAQDLDGSIARLIDRPELETTDDAPDGTTGARIAARETGYIQAIDEAGLVELGAERGITIKMLRRQGHFVAVDEILGVAIGVERLSQDDAEAIAQSIIIGRRRTGEQDPEYAIYQLVEVAVRALSPGINDPHTAMTCIDWLGAALRRVAHQGLAPSCRLDSESQLRLVLDTVTFGELLEASFNEIRHCCQSLPSVSARLLETLDQIARATEDPQYLEAVYLHAEMAFDSAQGGPLREVDRLTLERRFEDVGTSTQQHAG